MSHFNTFRWIRMLGLAAVGLAACSSGGSEPAADSSAIAPIEATVASTGPATSPPPATVSTTSVPAPAPTTTAAPTTTISATTTTEDPYNGLFTADERSAVDAFFAAQTAFHTTLAEQSENWRDDLARLHTAEAAADRIDFVEQLILNYEIEWPEGPDRPVVFYGKSAVPDALTLLLCYVDNAVVVDRTSGEPASTDSAATYVRAEMRNIDGDWRLGFFTTLEQDTENPICASSWPFSPS